MTFREIIESTDKLNGEPVEGIKKVYVKDYRGGVLPVSGGVGVINMSKKTPIGFIATKDNLAEGWNIYPLDASDKMFLKKSNISQDGVYRIASNKNITLVKLNLKTARMWWADNEAIEEEDKLVFEKRPTTWDRIVVDSDYIKEFNIKKKGQQYVF